MNKFVWYLRKTLTPFVKFCYPVEFIGGKASDIEEKSSILIANHISGWDPVIFAINCKADIKFLYKYEFRKSKFLAWGFDGMDLIPVKRGEADMASTRLIMRALHNEKPVWIFPEGTRNKDVEHFLPFKAGAATFAIKTHSPLRPIFTFDRYKAFKKNYVLIGEEFELSQFYDVPLTKDVVEAATKIIFDKMVDMRKTLEAEMKKRGISRRKLSPKKQLKYDESVAAHSADYAETRATFGDAEYKDK